MTIPPARTALVTGGSGFIGRHVVQRLLADGAQVTVVDAMPLPLSVHGEVELYRMTLPSAELGAVVSKGRFGEIYHLAGTSLVGASVEDPASDLERNAQGTLVLLEALRRESPASRLVYMSSAAVYGNPESLPISESAKVLPVSPYGVSKHLCEQYVALYCRVFGIRGAILRPFSVYGPGQPKQVVYDLIDRLSANPARLDVLGTGDELRDFVNVLDVAEAAVTVGRRALMQGEAYNVACGHGVAIRDLVSAITAVRGVSPEVRFSGEARVGHPKAWVADVSRLVSLGFRPRVDLDSGLRAVSAWYDEQRRA